MKHHVLSSKRQWIMPGIVSRIAPPKNKQRGAIMIIALVLLFVVTLIAMSGLKTASVQERMALNAQSSNTAFQTSESAVNSVLWRIRNNDKELLEEVRLSGASSPEAYSTSNPDVVASVQVRFIGEIDGDGDSLGKSASLGRSIFEIEGVAENGSTGAKATAIQGIHY